MAAIYEDRGDSYRGAYTSSSPEGVNITSQPQPQPLVERSAVTGQHHAGCPGPRTIPFTSVRHQGPGHEAPTPLDCPQCGQDIATALFSHLSAGVNCHKPVTPLQYCDVMVLTQDTKISDVSGVVEGLRDARVPVRVVGEEEIDVINNSADVNEVLVLWRGLASAQSARRVLVLLPSPTTTTSDPPSSLKDFRPVLYQAEHVILVWHATNGLTTEDVTLDVADGVVLESARLVNSEWSNTVGGNHHHDYHQHHPHLEEESLTAAASGDSMRGEGAPVVNTATYRFVQPADNRPYNSGYASTSRANPNNCCDQLCIACSQDAGGDSCILCCLCDCCNMCQRCCSMCEHCCQAFGNGLNHCIQSLNRDCCTSGDGCGDGCGDCGDCGNCGDCDCGDCNCDCGSCDCVIM